MGTGTKPQASADRSAQTASSPFGSRIATRAPEAKSSDRSAFAQRVTRTAHAAQLVLCQPPAASSNWR